MYYIKYFFLASLLGHIIENLICKNFESGILYGPWTPIYGFGIITILLISKKILKKQNINKITKYILIYISATLILTLFELIGGLLIEKIFGFSFWNYEDHKFHIGKYICLETTLIWGILSILFVTLLKKPLDKIINIIPNFTVYILSTLLFIDIIAKIIIKF